MKKLLLMLFSAILLTSCAGLTYISTPQNVALNTNNFKYIKSVSAETEAIYVFGIGGMSPSANADVIEKLIEEAHLKPNQALADIRIKTTNKCILGIIITRTLTASATVVEFFGPNEVSTESTNNEAQTTYFQSQKLPTTREATLTRLKEINTLLSNGSIDNIESIKAEINNIEQWYTQNGYYKLDERNGLKRAKSLIEHSQKSTKEK